jgi:hypothetical protein
LFTELASIDSAPTLFGAALAKAWPMRPAALALLALFAALSGCGPACPSSPEYFCRTDQEGLSCAYESEGRPFGCQCDSGAWICNDCPDLAEPIGACTAGASCSVWGFENDCACSCSASGDWSCVLGEDDPHFHCSP